MISSKKREENAIDDSVETFHSCHLKSASCKNAVSITGFFSRVKVFTGII